MLRVLQHSGADITSPLSGATSVGITREDGSVLVDGGTVASDVYTLSPTDTATLDMLTFTWSDGAESRRSFVEVVGGFTFDIADARNHKPIRDFPELYPDDRLEVARTAAEQALEWACGQSFTPRYGRTRLDGSGTDELLIPWPEPRELIAATVDGVELTPDELAEVEPLDYGALYREAEWPSGRRNIDVTVTHGYAYPPGRVPQAALALTLYLLTDGPLNDRTISATNRDGTYQSFVVAGVRGACFALPEVNAVVQEYDMKGGIA